MPAAADVSWPMDSWRTGANSANVPDDFNREGLGIEGDFSLPAERVVFAEPDHRMAWKASGDQSR